MKKTLFLFLIFQCFSTYSQNTEKTVLKILDAYLEIGVDRKYSKDSVMIYINAEKTSDGCAINLKLQPTYLGMVTESKNIFYYKGYYIFLDNVGKLENDISKKFIFLNAQPNIEQKKNSTEFVTIVEPKLLALFQVNKKNELYILETTDNKVYYNFLKSKIKISDKLNNVASR